MTSSSSPTGGSPTDGSPGRAPRVVVGAVAVESEDRYRPVTVWKPSGPLSFAARSVEDLERELRFLGVTADLDDSAQVEWRGGGREQW